MIILSCMESEALKINESTQVETLGLCNIPSPLKVPYIEPDARILFEGKYEQLFPHRNEKTPPITFENAGPRKMIYFDPVKTSAAIVTCGGLCPGLNNVVQSIVDELYSRYGVKRILGIRYGYEGLIPDYGHDFPVLTPESVSQIHRTGGSFLGSSRGNQDVSRMVDTLVANNIQILFTVGGDGTLRGALAIHNEIKKRGLKISVVGLPKTIDNDINLIDRTFGFETAVSEAAKAVRCGFIEAQSFRNGVGLIKVMGRDSGFIATFAALAANNVDAVLIPESPFKLTGKNSLIEYMKEILQKKKYAVIVVAEGAGAEYVSENSYIDASGNKKIGDIGIYLKDEINKHFKSMNFPISMKYIDPSYIIRSVPADADDSVFSLMLGQNAVHGAMAGKSGIMIGRWNSFFTFVPIKLAVEKRKYIEPNGYLWSIVKQSTGQPDFSGDDH